MRVLLPLIAAVDSHLALAPRFVVWFKEVGPE
jgi:hypothetical protein